MKRLRRHLQPLKIKYMACGEYGTDDEQPTKLGRPHFHAIIFNYDFEDKTFWRNSADNKLYRSALLEELWPFGSSEIGSATFKSAAYVARYCTKKINGDMAEEHYIKYDVETGQIYSVLPEFNLVSQGIGKNWYERYKSDTDKDYIHVNGIRCTVPKYYDYLADKELESSDLLATKKALRSQSIDALDPERSLDRLRVKETVKLAQFKQLRRNLQ